MPLLADEHVKDSGSPETAAERDQSAPDRFLFPRWTNYLGPFSAVVAVGGILILAGHSSYIDEAGKPHYKGDHQQAGYSRSCSVLHLFTSFSSYDRFFLPRTFLLAAKTTGALCYLPLQ